VIASDEIIRWQDASAVLWHQQPVSLATLGQLGWGTPQPLMELVLVNHELNYRLWHEEDRARDPAASDEVIASVKRRIDLLNQQRNDAIEQIDQAIASELISRQITAAADAGINTETPGSAIDRLSILALRLYHYSEQCERTDLDAAAAAKRDSAYRICQSQRDRLAGALDQLLGELLAGRRRHDVFHQLKMYNDPSLNPVLYARRSEN
jgi:hypothetical protein